MQAVRLQAKTGHIGGQYTPNPATWLNQCRWEDEVRDPRERDGPATVTSDQRPVKTW
jgi:hypothetical protein